MRYLGSGDGGNSFSWNRYHVHLTTDTAARPGAPWRIDAGRRYLGPESPPRLMGVYNADPMKDPNGRRFDTLKPMIQVLDLILAGRLWI